MSRGTDARKVALEVLLSVHRDGAYANLALPTALRQSTLDTRDRGFVTELVYGSLRRQGELDVVLHSVAKRKVEEIEGDVAEILRLGAYQLLFMRVPVHAAVDESVILAKAMRLSRATGFINGVLRSIARAPVEHWLETIQRDASTLNAHPLWIAGEIEKALSLTGDETELTEALEANNASPQVCLVCLPGLTSPRPTDERTTFSPWGLTLPGGDPADDARIASGAARVQDEGSQLAVLALLEAAPVAPGTRFLDMCAGPGGKAAVIAATALEKGGNLTAIETVAHRVRLVEDSLRAISTKNPAVVEVKKGDARAVSGTYDRILLDAPCSGLGALRRRPEARWRKSPDQLHELTVLQAELLDSGLRALAPGGILAYVTCSPVVAETTAIVEAALRNRPDVEVINTSSVLDKAARTPIPRSARGSAVQLWTHRHGTDAMFIQLLRKRPSV